MQNNSINFIRLLITIISFITIFPISTQAQLEWNNWLLHTNNSIQEISFKDNANFKINIKGVPYTNYFPKNNLKHINTGLISAISNSNNGKLELYTNGSLIYNKNNMLIENGVINNKIIDDTLIDFTVVGKPDFDIFFERNIIFKSKTNENIVNILTFTIEHKPGIYNTLVNLNGNDGNGSIIFKDSLIEANCIGVTGGYHKNGKDIWIITYNYLTNNLISILFDEFGNIKDKFYFNNYQQFNSFNPQNRSYLHFKLRMNNLSNKFAISTDSDNLSNSNVYLYDFNNETGRISYCNKYKTSNNMIGIEFSPNGKYLYVMNKLSNMQSLEIQQFNTFDNNENSEPKSKRIKTNQYYVKRYSPIRLALDGKIYFMEHQNIQKIYIISNPNYNFDLQLLDSLIIPNSSHQGSFQHTFPLYPPDFELKLYSNAPKCAETDTLKLFSLFSHSEIPDVTYEWTAPNGMTYTKDSIYIPNPNMSYSGKYYLRVKSKFLDVDMLDSIDVVLYPKPEYNLVLLGEPCGSAEITLKSDVEFPTTFKYLWNTGAITPELKVSKNGVYTLIVTDTNGCETSKSIEIIFGKKPIAEIRAMGATTFCEGGKVELRATGGMSSNDLNFEWNTSEKVPNIWVDKSGIYKVIITHKFSNCKDSAEIDIKVNPNLVSSIEQIGSLCKGSEVTLQAEPQGTEYKYLWSNGATTPSIKVSQAGKYTVEVSLDGTCKSSSEIDVIENQVQDFEILAQGKFCVGDSVMLSPSKKFKQYLWSTGDMTEKKGVTKSGTYKLIVTDENGCTNEKSINVEFVRPKEYKLDFTDYDFGDVEIGVEKIVKVNIPGELGFKLRGDFPLDINTMEMIFKPDAERDYSGEIVLNYGGECDTTATIKFKGRGINSVKYLAKVIAPKVTTEAGLANVELPITFEINDENIVYPFELDYKIKLSLNYDVYIPQIPSTINNNKREFEVVGKANITKGENILSTINGKTYLSQNMENEIEIVSFEHKTDRLEVEQEDGYLNITGICVPELRGLIFFTPTKMSVSPNPVSSDLTIKINTEEKGNHKLRLVDITGNSREVGDFEVKELTEKVIKLNSKELSKGQYFLELITPNQTIVEKVVVE